MRHAVVCGEMNPRQRIQGEDREVQGCPTDSSISYSQVIALQEMEAQRSLSSSESEMPFQTGCTSRASLPAQRPSSRLGFMLLLRV